MFEPEILHWHDDQGRTPHSLPSTSYASTAYASQVTCQICRGHLAAMSFGTPPNATSAPLVAFLPTNSSSLDTKAAPASWTRVPMAAVMVAVMLAALLAGVGLGIIIINTLLERP